MKKSEMNMKTMMLEVNALVQDWEDHYLNHIFLENRLPKIKDVKSSDGDAPTPRLISARTTLPSLTYKAHGVHGRSI